MLVLALAFGVWRLFLGDEREGEDRVSFGSEPDWGKRQQWRELWGRLSFGCGGGATPKCLVQCAAMKRLMNE